MNTQELLQQDIRTLKGVGEQRARLFSKLGVSSIDTLLRTYPRSYLDLSAPCPVAQAPVGEVCAVRATVQEKKPAVRIRGGKTLGRVFACDETGDLTLLYFNNPYGPASLQVGQDYIFYGKAAGGLLAKEMTNPIVRAATAPGGLIPRYPLTEGLSSRMVENAVKNALDLIGELPETLPAPLLEEYGLVSRDEAVRNIHRPATAAKAAQAKKRLIFEELFTLKAGMNLIRSRTRGTTGVRIPRDGLEDFIRSLPFPLTGAQRRGMEEIAADLAGPRPMSRLLQGDVGSGKTVVAAAGVFLAAKSGFQSAVMAPTEVLAAQHAETFHRLLAPFGLRVGLLTGSVKTSARRSLLAAVAAGEIDLVVGTHALLSEGVSWQRLGFAVADEQHRFGVRQRSALRDKGASPHLLVMSATPIPRTLALILYGDLDLSVIDEMPPGRRPVKTLLVSSALRERYLGFVRKTVAEGHAAFIVCPLVDESEALEDTVAATEYARELKENYLHGLRVGLVHGRMKARDKADVMEAFRQGALDVLVSTTVIEVGVDVPRATLMIVENAERFGLSALHQLRGRVGRGGDESYCVLVSSSESPTARKRLQVLTNTNDGFAIAREDLKTRGPGDFFGSRQHGLPELDVADLAGDEQVLYDAAKAADRLLAEDPTLSLPQNRELRRAVEMMFRASEGIFN